MMIGVLVVVVVVEGNRTREKGIRRERKDRDQSVWLCSLGTSAVTTPFSSSFYFFYLSVV